MNTPRFLAIFLSVTLAIAGVALTAAPAAANGCIDYAAGTQSDPYLIQTPANLTCLNNNSSYYWGGGKYFRQTANLDMTGANWTSGIGNSTTEFTGHYDGGNYSVDNLSITATHSSSYFVGGLALFGYLASTGTIDNLKISNISVSLTGSGSTSFIGTVVGLNAGSVNNVYTEGTVNVDETGTVFRVGGFAGSGAGTASNISSDVDVSITTRTASPSNIAYAGGFMGEVTGTVTAAKNSGSLTIISAAYVGQSSSFIGGLDGGSLSDSYSSAGINITSPQLISHVGMIVGNVIDSAITRVYVDGLMSLNPGNGTSYIGTLVGSSIGASSLTNSYWDQTMMGQTYPAVGAVTSGSLNQAGTSGKPTVTLSKYSTYSTTTFLSTPWNIYNGFESTATSTWGICSGVSKPFLRALTSSNPCPAAPVLSLGATNVSAGDSLVVTASGYLPNEQVRIELHSVPEVLATVQASSSGAFTTTVTIPATTIAGNHELVLIGLTGELVTSSPISVTSALAKTGSYSEVFLPSAVMLLATGALVMRLRRRVRS